MTSATLSSKFQLVIPKAIRDELQLKAGQKFVVITKGDVIELIPQRSMEWARGLLKGLEPGEYRDREDRY